MPFHPLLSLIPPPPSSLVIFLFFFSYSIFHLYCSFSGCQFLFIIFFLIIHLTSKQVVFIFLEKKIPTNVVGIEDYIEHLAGIFSSGPFPQIFFTISGAGLITEEEHYLFWNVF
jgi:hypothetical protein